MTSIAKECALKDRGGKCCSICGEWKEYSSFTKHATMKDGYLKQCKECKRKQEKEKRKKRNEMSEEERLAARAKDKKKYKNIISDERRNQKRKQTMRSLYLRRKYGITIEQYEDMHQTQEGRCGICSIEEQEAPRKILNVDHCHETGVVRGLLCDRCNLGIGILGDNLNSVQRALDYLQRSTCDLCVER